MQLVPLTCLLKRGRAVSLINGSVVLVIQSAPSCRPEWPKVHQELALISSPLRQDTSSSRHQVFLVSEGSWEVFFSLSQRETILDANVGERQTKLHAHINKFWWERKRQADWLIEFQMSTTISSFSEKGFGLWRRQKPSTSKKPTFSEENNPASCDWCL